MKWVLRTARGLALALVTILLALLVYDLATGRTPSTANLRLAVIWPSGKNALLSTRSLRGRPVVLNFWASWCSPCRHEAGVLRTAASRTRGKVDFVGVDVHDATSDARSFLRQYDITYTVVRGTEAAISAYRVEGLPVTIYLDAGGHEVARTVGEVTARALATNLARTKIWPRGTASLSRAAGLTHIGE
jgi:cytochrome c biogenesis protein CcmG, thiol:disulfide interchange protein DsbE